MKDNEHKSKVGKVRKDVSVNPFFLSKEHHPYGAKPRGSGEYRYSVQS